MADVLAELDSGNACLPAVGGVLGWGVGVFVWGGTGVLPERPARHAHAPTPLAKHGVPLRSAHATHTRTPNRLSPSPPLPPPASPPLQGSEVVFVNDHVRSATLGQVVLGQALKNVKVGGLDGGLGGGCVAALGWGL
jgi:hypothetical protein